MELIPVEIVRVPHRITVCPKCGGKLGSDKSAVTSEQGFRYRERECEDCGKPVYTKQPPESLCGG